MQKAPTIAGAYSPAEDEFRDADSFSLLEMDAAASTLDHGSLKLTATSGTATTSQAAVPGSGAAELASAGGELLLSAAVDPRFAQRHLSHNLVVPILINYSAGTATNSYVPTDTATSPASDPRTWVLIPKSGFGNECGKIGVRARAFVSVPDPCSKPHGHCLENQLSSYLQRPETYSPAAVLWGFTAGLTGTDAAGEPRASLTGAPAVPTPTAAGSPTALRLRYSNAGSRIPLRVSVALSGAVAVREPIVSLDRALITASAVVSAGSLASATLAVRVANIGDAAADFAAAVTCTGAAVSLEAASPLTAAAISPAGSLTASVTARLPLLASLSSASALPCSCTVSASLATTRSLYTPALGADSFSMASFAVMVRSGSGDSAVVALVATAAERGYAYSGEGVVLRGDFLALGDTAKLVALGAACETAPASAGTAVDLSAPIAGAGGSRTATVTGPVGTYNLCYKRTPADP